MQIDLGDFRLCSDSYNLWIEKRVKVKNKSNGNYRYKYEQCSGYHSNWGKLFESFMDYSVRGSNATTVKKAMKDIDEAKRKGVKAFSKLQLPPEKEFMKR